MSLAITQDILLKMGQEINLVTGAFSFSGKYIAQILFRQGKKVRTLTNHPERESDLKQELEIFPYAFDFEEKLVQSFEGVEVFYNTYWVRFPYREIGYHTAVENSKKLIHSAKKAGVKRIVHLSITNPSLDSPFPYFRGKAEIEKAIMESGLSYAILRPALIFGTEDLLINNIAWLLRKFPLFALPGKGDYQVQPIFVQDLAELAVNAGEKNENLILDALGPEVFSFKELVRLIQEKIQAQALILPLPPKIFILLSQILSRLVGDIVLTPDEVYGLMSNLLVSKSPPLGKTKLSDWLEQNRNQLGLKYASELKRHFL